MKTQRMEQMVVGMPCQKIVCNVDRRTNMKYLQDSSSTPAHADDSLCEQVKTKSPIGEALKRKLSFGATSVLQIGSTKRVFKKVFGCREGEKIGKVFRCFLSTTAGPIQGLLFITNKNFLFCSSKLIKIPSANGEEEAVQIHYKVSIPLQRITNTNARKNQEKPAEKYIQVVTSDNYDFWFMGFFNHHKAYKYLHSSVPHDSSSLKESHLRLN